MTAFPLPSRSSDGNGDRARAGAHEAAGDPAVRLHAAQAAHRAHGDRVAAAFTRLGAAPTSTFPLVLASITIAGLAMHVDLVAKYSASAFWAGIAATGALAFGVGVAMKHIASGGLRLVAALGLPTVGGALVGMLVQTLVLASPDVAFPVRDLGGLVDSTQPVPWVLSGIVLGAVPALLVSVFLVLAGRALKKLAGNDAAEGFGVVFAGVTGVLSALGLLVVETSEMLPLVLVTVLAAITVLVAFLVDGARLDFLRGVFAGERPATGDVTYEVVPADRFRHDPSVAPMVAQASAVSVLVRVQRRIGSYRDAAAEPIALLADTVEETTRPLRRRRVAAAALLATMTSLGGIALFTATHSPAFLLGERASARYDAPDSNDR